MVETIKTVELHHGAKFCRNRSKSGQDMVIFQFFKMEAAILDFQEFKFLMLKKAKRVELRHCAKFRQNRSNRGAEI